MSYTLRNNDLNNHDNHNAPEDEGHGNEPLQIPNDTTVSATEIPSRSSLRHATPLPTPGAAGAAARSTPGFASRRNNDNDNEDDNDDNEDDDDDDDNNNNNTEDINTEDNIQDEDNMNEDSQDPHYDLPEGAEHTGRWTKEEHHAFLKGIQVYGKEWKKIAALVKTRTVVQTRTHAQKYFQKVQKAKEKGDDTVDMNYSAEKPCRKTKRQRAKQPQQNTSTTDSTNTHMSTLLMQTPAAVASHRSRSSTTLSAAQVISNLSGGEKAQPVLTPSGPPSVPYNARSWSSMAIRAPPVTLHNQFPEPSPAATGKRKLAELAAARMLAGAMGDGPPTPPSATATSPAPQPSQPRAALTLQIVNPESLGVTHATLRAGGDSPTTPWEGALEELVQHRTVSEPPRVGLPNWTLPVVAQGHVYERSLLHQRICGRDMDGFRQQVEEADERMVNRLDAAGYSCLHSACALRLTLRPEAANCASDMVRMLVQKGADPSQSDENGNTPLHWAARAGDVEAAETLLYRNSHMDAKNHQGESPLHWAMRTGRRGARVVQLLLESGAKAGILNQHSRRPLDVAGEGFLDEDSSLASVYKQQNDGKKVSKELKRALRESEVSRRECRANFFLHSKQSRSLVLCHPKCLEHQPKSEHDWEAPDRINYIMGRVLPSTDSAGNAETSGIFPYEVVVSQEFEKAKLDLLSRVHSAEYLSFVNNLHKELEKQLQMSSNSGNTNADGDMPPPPPPVIPFTPMVQRQMIKVDEASVKQGINSDTSFSVGSLTAARYAAGAVQHAVDRVLVGRNRNAFCVVRPPGHHAGINGLLDKGESCGFCIFNNVAAGALYAISDDRLLCERCAIVDIDVHHGNGTEEIIRKCHDPRKLFFFSIHLYDNDTKKKTANRYAYKFYPGTGEEDDLALNIINVPIVPLWKQTPGSSHQPEKTRKPTTRQKTRSSQEDTSSDSDHVREGSQTSATSDVGSCEPASSTGNGFAPGGMSGRLAYREAIKSRLLPALRAFNPDLILISAGFDASKGDVGNARHERGGKERIGLDLEPEDYAWTTRQILGVADMCCNGRVVSVLEGGYGRSNPTGEGLDRSGFAECAVRHLHALVDPYNTEQRFNLS